MADTNPRQAGLAAYASQFGIPADAVQDRLTSIVGTGMALEAIDATGRAWADGPLSWRERSLAVITCLATLGGVDDRLASHLRWGLRNGLTPAEIDDLLRTLAAYIGYPRATVAMEAFRAILEEDADAGR
jgi:4-carboxymuconolactone decarboxylase